MLLDSTLKPAEKITPALRLDLRNAATNKTTTIPLSPSFSHKNKETEEERFDLNSHSHRSPHLK